MPSTHSQSSPLQLSDSQKQTPQGQAAAVTSGSELPRTEPFAGAARVSLPEILAQTQPCSRARNTALPNENNSTLDGGFGPELERFGSLPSAALRVFGSRHRCPGVPGAQS